MKLVGFEGEAEFNAFRAARPDIDLGITRGLLASPGIYEQSGTDADGAPIMVEIEPPTAYGYCCAIDVVQLPPELELHEISPDPAFTGYSALPWRRPEGAHDAYPAGTAVMHDGRLWVSLVAANVWEPGVSGWRNVADPASEELPEWVQPSGSHDAYPLGYRVAHVGKGWVNDRPANVWEPGSVNSGWSEIEAPGDDWPAWVQPTGAHDAYALGAQVTHAAARWVSSVAGNVWEPGVYGWTRQD